VSYHTISYDDIGLTITRRPLSTVGIPYYREQLLSAWPGHQMYEVGNPPAKIDPAILGNLRVQSEYGAWATNPRKVRRNQATKTRVTNTNNETLAAPKFLSEKARESDHDDSGNRRISDIQELLVNAALSGSTKTEVPVMYRNVEIKYSKFGVDDFDFK
jgi:PAB-dependent poly(A)-specific ribonuclease subunit 2